MPRAAKPIVVYECEICLKRISKDAIVCMNCGTTYPAVPASIVTTPEAFKARSEQQRIVRGGAPRLYDVEDVPIVRLQTGDPAIDLVTGGGFARGKAYAIHGPGGSGKSRIALRAAVCLCAIGHVVYASASAEEEAKDIRRHAKTAGYFKKRCVRDRLICFDRIDDPEELVDKIISADPTFVVVDASSALEDDRYAARLLRDLSHETEITLLGIHHENVDGKMSGGSKLGYLVDAVLDVDRVRKTKKGTIERTEEPSAYVRLRSTGKNRYGRPGVFALLELDDKDGFDHIDIDAMKVETKKRGAAA